MEFVGAAHMGDNPLGAEDHHQDHGHAEDKHTVIAENSKIFRQNDDNEGSDDKTGNRTYAAEDDDGKDHGRFDKIETGGIDESGFGGKDYAHHTGPARPDSKGRSFRLGRIYAHGRGSCFTPPDGNPGPADAGVLQAPDNKYGKQAKTKHDEIKIDGKMINTQADTEQSGRGYAGYRSEERRVGKEC